MKILTIIGLIILLLPIFNKNTKHKGLYLGLFLIALVFVWTKNIVVVDKTEIVTHEVVELPNFEKNNEIKHEITQKDLIRSYLDDYIDDYALKQKVYGKYNEYVYAFFVKDGSDNVYYAASLDMNGNVPWLKYADTDLFDNEGNLLPEYTFVNENEWKENIKEIYYQYDSNYKIDVDSFYLTLDYELAHSDERMYELKITFDSLDDPMHYYYCRSTDINELKDIILSQEKYDERYVLSVKGIKNIILTYNNEWKGGGYTIEEIAADPDAFFVYKVDYAKEDGCSLEYFIDYYGDDFESDDEAEDFYDAYGCIEP